MKWWNDINLNISHGFTLFHIISPFVAQPVSVSETLLVWRAVTGSKQARLAKFPQLQPWEIALRNCNSTPKEHDHQKILERDVTVRAICTSQLCPGCYTPTTRIRITWGLPSPSGQDFECWKTLNRKRGVGCISETHAGILANSQKKSSQYSDLFVLGCFRKGCPWKKWFCGQWISHHRLPKPLQSLQKKASHSMKSRNPYYP